MKPFHPNAAWVLAWFGLTEALRAKPTTRERGLAKAPASNQ